MITTKNKKGRLNCRWIWMHNGNEREFIQNQNFPKLAKNPHNRTFGKIAKGREMYPSIG